MDKPFKAYDGNAPCIFISYAHSDKETVFKCIDRLHKRGFRIWYDEGIEPGTKWYEVLASKIDAAECVLLFMSRHSLHSPYVTKEITCATGKKKHIVCVVLDGSRAQGSFELMLCDTQMMNHGGSAFFERLEKALRPELTREGGAAPGGIRAAGRWKAWAVALAAGVALGAAGLHVAGFFGTPEDGRLEAQRKTPEFAALEKKALAGDASAQCDLGLTLLRGEAFRRIRPRAWNGLPERQGRAMPKRRTILAKCTVWGRACPRTTARRRICLPRPPRRAMRKRSAASASCTATERAFRRIRAG
jgi:hypothetical protein